MGKGWKNPKKLAIAQKKGKLFTKAAREISVAARLGSEDPEANPRLKMAITAARAISCPKDTIERAIKKGAGNADGGAIEELTYEGFAPHNVGLIIECQTDNKNRTVSDLRTLFKKKGGNLGENGSVQWMFEHLGAVEAIKANITDAEEEAIEAGANDVEAGDDENSFIFYTDIADLESVKEALTKSNWEIASAGPSYRATTITELTDDQKDEVIEFLDHLDDLDDTHCIHASI